MDNLCKRRIGTAILLGAFLVGLCVWLGWFLVKTIGLSWIPALLWLLSFFLLLRLVNRLEDTLFCGRKAPVSVLDKNDAAAATTSVLSLRGMSTPATRPLPSVGATICALYLLAGLYLLIYGISDVMGFRLSHLSVTLLSAVVGTLLLQTLRQRASWAEGMIAAALVASAPMWTVGAGRAHFTRDMDFLAVVVGSIPLLLLLEFVRRPAQAPAYRAAGGIALAAASLGGLVTHIAIMKAPFFDGDGLLPHLLMVVFIPLSAASPLLGAAFLQLCTKEKVEEFFRASLFLILAPIAIFTFRSDPPFGVIVGVGIALGLAAAISFAAIVMGAVIARRTKSYQLLVRDSDLPVAISTQVAPKKRSWSNSDRAQGKAPASRDC